MPKKHLNGASSASDQSGAKRFSIRGIVDKARRRLAHLKRSTIVRSGPATGWVSTLARTERSWTMRS